MKLPVNLLLYTLSAGLLGGVGWVFYQALVEAPKKQRSANDIKNDVENLIKVGQGKQPPESSWSYLDAAWWSKLKTVNFTGKLPPPPPKPDSGPSVVKPVESPDTKLEDILSGLAIVYKGSLSSCVIRYKPTARVTPPADLARSGPSDVIGAPSAPSPGRPPVPGRGPTPMPAAVDPSAGLIHHLKLEDTLWPPYQNVRLVAISDDAQIMTFLREKDGVPKEQWKKEDVFRNELGLPEDVNTALKKWMGVGAGSRPSQGSRPQRPNTSDQASGWKPVETTRELDPGQWHISEKDYRYLQDNSERVVNEDIVVQPYKSPQGTRAGLQITKVSPELSQYGLATGDVILSINGEPVTSKAQAAQAVQAGQKQYERGTREFEIEVLSRGQISKRTYHAPNNRR